MIYLPERDNPKIIEAQAASFDNGIDVFLSDEQDNIEEAMYKLTTGKVDAVVCGIDHPSSEILRTAIRIVGVEDELVSSFFVMQKDEERLIFADCAVIPNPSSGQLATIAMQTAKSARKIGLEPRVAFLSFSTDHSARTAEVEKIRDAIGILARSGADFYFDGEWQFDAAYNPEIRKLKTENPGFDEPANVFIFPDLNSANIAYKVAQQLGDYTAVGVMLQGLKKPVIDLSRGSTVEDIVQVIMLTDEMLKS